MTEPADVRAARAVLERHYKEPVRPVSQYCNAFEKWAQALVDRKARLDALPKEDVWPGGRDDTLDTLAETVGQARMAIYKSSMLARLIYAGEAHRTEMCPEHKGQWCGLEWGPEDANHCAHGCQLTGWLPA